ncbi:UNVERIFIED_CONTAM: ist1 [Sesamum radiatum]|uniref:Ist1 n=1 Tax=Sesamum radiatum TaxID=300843 RepID=A0AAW2QFE3_SESRA
MLDSFFNKGFKAAKCKTLLKLTIPRIKLLRNRREIQMKNMRREIAKLLETGQEATARIRVEHIIREEKMTAAQEIVELFCELITVRLPIIEAQRECPLDLKEAISSLCFAAPRCADLPELLQVQMMFAGKYGKEFVSAATELRPECGVNRQLVELLSVRAPAPDVKLKLLKEIAEEHELEWDPSASEGELLKPHEDLLNGPTQFVSGSNFPLPKEKHDETKSTAPEPASLEHSDSDEDFEIIDFPEVPKQPLVSNKDTVSVPEMLPFPVSALSEVDDQEEHNPAVGSENLPYLETRVTLPEKSVIKEDAYHKLHPVKWKTVCAIHMSFIRVVYIISGKRINSPPPPSKTKYDNEDLQDILAAAHEASETAERAAAAARSAASIAQLRISELVKKKDDEVSECTMENPFYLDKTQTDPEGKAELDLQKPFDSPLTSPTGNNFFDNYMAHQPAAHPSYDDSKWDFDSSPHSNNFLTHGSLHRPQISPSLDDDTYFSYPNLFTSQGSNISSPSHLQTTRNQETEFGGLLLVSGKLLRTVRENKEVIAIGLVGSWVMIYFMVKVSGSRPGWPTRLGKKIEAASYYFVHAPLDSVGYISIGRVLLFQLNPYDYKLDV